MTKFFRLILSHFSGISLILAQNPTSPKIGRGANFNGNFLLQIAARTCFPEMHSHSNFEKILTEIFSRLYKTGYQKRGVLFFIRRTLICPYPPLLLKPIQLKNSYLNRHLWRAFCVEIVVGPSIVSSKISRFSFFNFD